MRFGNGLWLDENRINMDKLYDIVLLNMERTVHGLCAARRLRHPQSFVSKYESGERHLDVIKFVEVCKVLEVSPSGVIKLLAC